MNGVSMIVILRSRSEGSVRVDITAGTVQPNPISIGTMLRPESPIFRSSLSIKNATRAMYPESSRSERKKKSTTMIGMKLSTLPTPVKMPSTMSDCIASLTPDDASAVFTTSVNASIPSASQSWSAAPITLNVSQKTSAMIRMKAGIAVYFPVRIRSIRRLLTCSRLS